MPWEEGVGETGLGQPEAAGEGAADPLQFANSSHPIWELTALSSTCCNKLICTWMVVAALTFSSPFNTIQTLLLGERLRVMGVNPYCLPDY